MRRIEPSRFLRPFMLVLVVAGCGCVSALREPPPLEDLAAAAQRRTSEGPFAEAQRLWNERTPESVRAAAERFQASVTDKTVQIEALIGAARARLWIADHHDDAVVRLAEAEEAIALAQWCGRVDSAEPECEYLLALGLGLQARERRSTAIDGLPRIIRLLESSIERQPLLDDAGPHRVLALVYLRSPGWPAGPGDLDLGFEQAQLAVQLVPDYPPNQMALAEAHRELDEIDASRAAYREAERLAAQRLEQNAPDAREWLEQTRHAIERLEQR